MAVPSWMNGPPKSILLATDLSPRCDRALDRALALSQSLGARLIIVHALERFDTPAAEATLPSWRRPPDPLAAARRRLLAEFGPLVESAAIVIEEGKPAASILRAAERHGCDLIVTGTARSELFGRLVLGSTVEQLLRGSRVPVLVVRSRARPYGHVVVATDFSDSSRHALEAAARFFPQHPLTVFHAFEPMLSGLAPDAAAYRQSMQDAAAQACEAFLEAAEIDDAVRRQARRVLEPGPAVPVLRDYVSEFNGDLVVCGTHGRSAVLGIFIGSVAHQITEEMPCDVLVVREPRSAPQPIA